MARLTSFLLATFTIVCVLIATERSAWGYIDPGSGFVALQTLASVLAACGYFMRRRIAGLFSRDRVASPAPKLATAPLTSGPSEPHKAA